MKRLKGIAFFYASLVSILIGLGAGLFLTVTSELINLVWSRPVLSRPVWMLALAVIFGLIIGILQAKIGQYPKTIKQILAEFKASGKVESQSWKTWINGAVILASGASVGPEASMTGIIARQSSWLGQKLTNFVTDADLAGASFWQQNQGFFKAKSEANQPLKSVFASQKRQKAAYAIWIALGIVAFICWMKVFPESKVFGISWKAVNWTWQGLALSPVALVIGLLFGYFFLKMEQAGAWLSKKIKSSVLKGALGGLLLGIFGIFSTYFLWSGAFTMWKLVKEAAVLGPVMLLFLAFGKAILTNLGFGLGWRGGTIFPAIFCSISLGIAFALVLPWSQNLLVAIITAASVSLIVGRPKLVAVLLIFLFTLRLAPVILTVCWLCEQLLNTKWLLDKLQ